MTGIVLIETKATGASMLCALGSSKKPVYALVSHLHIGKWLGLFEKGESKGKGCF